LDVVVVVVVFVAGVVSAAERPKFNSIETLLVASVAVVRSTFHSICKMSFTFFPV